MYRYLDIEQIDIYILGFKTGKKTLDKKNFFTFV